MYGQTYNSNLVCNMPIGNRCVGGNQSYKIRMVNKIFHIIILLLGMENAELISGFRKCCFVISIDVIVNIGI